MKKLDDITILKVWTKLKKMGFKKIKFTFQGLAYGYGAENDKITIEPTFRPKLKWVISNSGKNRHVKTVDILKTVEDFSK